MMKSRRKARIVGQEDEVEDVGTTDSRTSGAEDIVVKRPVIRPKHSKSRLSFGPGAGTSMGEEESGSASEVFTPKKSNLSRQAIEKNALRKTGLSGLSVEVRPVEAERPSYTKDFLTELKNSTPSTPKDLRGLSPNPDAPRTLDIAAKFGTDVADWNRRDGSNGLIPTDAEIQEKKSRRARLALEKKHRVDTSGQDEEMDDEEFRQAQDSDDDEFKTQHDRISLSAPSSKSKHPETRLVRDDENLMEDFDEFVEDGKVMLGRKAEKAQKMRQKKEIRELIDEAEGFSPEGDSDEDSEKGRLEEFEAAQTRKGMEGLRVAEDFSAQRSKTPPKITPLPSLSGCIERLQVDIAKLEYTRSQQVQKMEDIARERQDIQEQEKHIQMLLQETAARYEKLCADAGMGTNGFADAVGQKLLDSATAASVIG